MRRSSLEWNLAVLHDGNQAEDAPFQIIKMVALVFVQVAEEPPGLEVATSCEGHQFVDDS
jgi:hypothetical protein